MSNPLLPATGRPRLPAARIAQLLMGVQVSAPVVLVGVRGYYRDTMGVPGQNDRAIYDDAIFLHSSQVGMAFNANCDPSAWRPGIASLDLGLWWYQLGIHGRSKPVAEQYEALVQAEPVRVTRDAAPGGKPQVETGWFGINIHRGGYGTTSSLGCQTVHPEQWDAFLAAMKDQMQRHGVKRVPYLLVDGPLV